MDRDPMIEIDAAESALHEDSGERLDASPSFWCRAGVLLLALLALHYHADGALGDVVSGSTSQDGLVLSWEYDLETGLGEVFITTFGYYVYGENDRVSFDGILPPEGGHDSYSHDVISFISPCWPLEVEEGELYANLNQFGLSAVVEVHGMALPQTQCPVPPYEWQAVAQPVEYGRFLLSGLGDPCVFDFSGTMDNFMTIAPMVVPCGCLLPGDDEPTDLADFADFQNNFRGAGQLPCLDEFLDSFEGPGE